MAKQKVLMVSFGKTYEKIFFNSNNALSSSGRTPVPKTVIPSEGVAWVRIPGEQFLLANINKFV